MTLRGLYLHPYKAHADLNLEKLPAISVLIGPNNSGKSAVLHAAALPKYGLSWDPVLPTAPWDNRTMVGNPYATVDLQYTSAGSPLVIQFRGAGTNTITCEIRTPTGALSGYGLTIPQPNQRSIWSPLQGSSPDSQAVFFLGAFRAVPRRSFVYRGFSRDVGPDGGECWNSLFELKAADSPKFEEIRAEMSGLGLGVRGVRTPTAAEGSGSIHLENYGRSDSLPFVGSGTNSVLPVVTQGTLCESGETFLVEEPELHLHKSAVDGLGAFFGKMAARGVQIMMTTHSTAFLGSLYRGVEDGRVPNDVGVFVFDRKPSGETVVRRIPLDSYHEALNTANDALGRLP